MQVRLWNRPGCSRFCTRTKYSDASLLKTIPQFRHFAYTLGDFCIDDTVLDTCSHHLIVFNDKFWRGTGARHTSFFYRTAYFGFQRLMYYPFRSEAGCTYTIEIRARSTPYLLIFFSISDLFKRMIFKFVQVKYWFSYQERRDNSGPSFLAESGYGEIHVVTTYISNAG